MDRMAPNRCLHCHSGHEGGIARDPGQAHRADVYPHGGDDTVGLSGLLRLESLMLSP